MGRAEAMGLGTGQAGASLWQARRRDGRADGVTLDDRRQSRPAIATATPRTGPQFLAALAPTLKEPRDTWYKRAIPALLLILLMVAVAARVFMLAASGDEMDRNARHTLELVTELAGERLLDRPGLEDVAQDAALAGDILASVQDLSAERTYALISSTGQLFATTAPSASGEALVHTPARPALAETDLSRIIISLAGQDGTARVVLRDGATHLATLRKVSILPSGATLMLLVLQDEPSIYANWMRDIAFEFIVLAASAISLAVLLIAYLKQNARVRASHAGFHDACGRFHTALLRGRCGMWDWDLARARMTWSPSMFAILGHAPHDAPMSVLDVASLVHPDDLDLVTLGNDAFARAGAAIDRRFRMRTAADGWTWVRMRAELVTDNRGGAHLIGIAVDVSEQEALERESERADGRLRDAVESISEAFVLWDSRRRLVLWNSKFQQFYALDSKTLVRGARYEDVIALGRKPLSSRKVNALRETEPGASTMEVELDDGRWLQVNERRTKDGGIVSVQTDITQIKRNEEKLLQSERRLMASVADLEETQLQLTINAQHLSELAEMHREASKKAEAASRIKSEFMANISHELRTPLNAILGFSEMMTGETFGPMGSPKYSEYADDIHDSGIFLLGVINDILDMSKIEAGRFQIEPETFDLAETVDESLRIIDVQANQKKLVLQRSVPENVEIEADRRATKQILLNLLSNAVKFTPSGGEIHVKVRRDEGMVKMLIADTGCGIKRDALKRIGVPFEQAQNAFTNANKGSGLGLAIARSLAKLHGGSLVVRSIEGKGTNVLVRLPERQSPKPKAEPSRPVESPKKETGAARAAA